MGKVDRLRNRVEHFASLFWALGIELANTWSVQKACPYMVIVGSILSEDALPPPLFLPRYLIFLWVRPCWTARWLGISSERFFLFLNCVPTDNSWLNYLAGLENEKIGILAIMRFVLKKTHSKKKKNQRLTCYRAFCAIAGPLPFLYMLRYCASV